MGSPLPLAISGDRIWPGVNKLKLMRGMLHNAAATAAAAAAAA